MAFIVRCISVLSGLGNAYPASCQWVSRLADVG